MARDINSVVLVGRLTRDPELTYTQNQTPVCKFSIALNRQGANGQDEVSFFNIVTWSKVATVCSQYLKKGSQVIVEGRLQQSRYQDKTGANRSSVDVVAQSVQFIGGRSDGDSKPSESKPADENATKKPDQETGIEFQDFEKKDEISEEPPF